MPDADVNSLVTYIYRDAGNYKFRASIVVGGTLKLQELTPHLFDGEFLSQRGLACGDSCRRV